MLLPLHDAITDELFDYHRVFILYMDVKTIKGFIVEKNKIRKNLINYL